MNAFGNDRVRMYRMSLYTMKVVRKTVCNVVSSIGIKGTHYNPVVLGAGYYRQTA